MVEKINQNLGFLGISTNFRYITLNNFFFIDVYIVIIKKNPVSRVSEDFVYKDLGNLNINKSTGIDGINSKFQKDGPNVIKCSITHIINLSIDTGIVPD